MSESERDNQLARQQQKAASKGFGPYDRTAQRLNLGLTGQCRVCTTNPASPAFRSEHDGLTVEFCSAECKATFDADPGQYTSTARA